MSVEKSRSRDSGLLTWNDIEPWQRDNEFILTSYRHASFSYQSSIESILELHNETTNIWTHLLGAAQFLIGLGQFLQLQSLASSAAIPLSDYAAIALYYVCVVACFGVSTFYHAISDHSSDIHKFGNQLDHLGIVFVIWGTGISGTHFAFYCDQNLQKLYFAAITAIALGCGVFALQPKFRQPTYRTVRFLLYCFLGTSLFAPALHGALTFGFETLAEMMDLKSFLGLALVNFSGAAIYAARIPERWFPGTFDLVGQSHNLMHVLIVGSNILRSTATASD